MFPKSSDSIREAVPTADEGDALLDMLFDDAPRDSAPAEAEAQEQAAPPIKSTPPPREVIPEPPPTPKGEVVAPPGWPRPARPAARPSAETVPDPDAVEQAAASLDALDDDDDLSGATIVAHSAMAVAPREPFGAPPDPGDADVVTTHDAALADVAESIAPDALEVEPAALEVEPAALEVEPGEDEVAAAVAPTLSERPVAPPRAPLPTLGFSDELDAAALLASRGATSKVVARAEMLLAEAQLQSDKVARARLLLVASELYAQAGEDDLAAGTARDAHALAPNLAMPLRQHRAMMVRSGDWARASEALEAELRHMPTPEARAHAAWLLAEVSRVLHQDDAAAKKRVEQASRAHPTDPRQAVSKFIEAVGANDAAAIGKIRVPDPEAHADLAAAFSLSASLRGLPSKGGAARTPRHVAEAVLWAREALASNDPSAVEQVMQLRQASFAAPASWVGAAFAAAKPDTRPNAVALLRTAADGSAHLQATRALARLAVETNQPVDGRDVTIFGPTDRVTLAAFDAAGSGPAARAARETLAGIVDDAGANPGGEGETVAELSGAVIAALVGSPSQRLSRLRFAHAGEPAARAAALLGRTLGTAGGEPDGAAPGMTATIRDGIDAALTEVASAGSESGEPSAYVRALMLELDIDAGSAERVAQTVATWGSADAPDATATLAAAILAEVAGDAAGALKIYADLHQESPTSEAIARILAAEAGDAPLGTAALRDFAERVTTPQHKATLFTECAIRLQAEATAAADAEGGDKEAPTWTEAAESAAKIAAEADPEIPIATHLGELGARSRADQESLLDWLRFRRETSDDLVERAYDLVREALLVSDGESSTASTLLEEALRARPDDYCLRDLYERLSPEPPGDRGAWREARATELQGAGDGARQDASRLAVEAALEYERTGDLDAAARCARLADSLGERELSPIAAYRFALAGFGTAELVDALLPQARNATEPDLRIEIYERLAELDERGREDTASGLLFRRTILEENPTHVRTLRRVASALMSGGREEELEPIAMELARTLEGGEAAAYAALASRLRWRTAWEQTAEPVAIAYAQQPRPLWAIRQMSAHARHRGDHAVVASCERELLTLTDRPAEQATLALRAAESLSALGEVNAARDLLSAAVEACPQHVVARLSLASTLESLGAWEFAANELVAAAREIHSPEWRTELDFRAAVLLQDKVGDVGRAREALERVSAVDPGHADVFDRLRAIYTSTGARSELAELLSRRLQGIDDPNERVEMEVMRGKALAEVGDSQEAKRALAAALEANPDHVEALSSFADLCHEEGDYEGSEQALIRLARLTADPDRQIDIYLRLGALYDDPLDNPERAEAAYQEILKRRPADESARLRLINLYRRSGNPTRALEEQNVLVNAAETPEDKCARTVELAEILEETGELKKAENTLVVARKSFPKSDLALRALVQFYQRTGQAPAAAVLLDRAVADARRALATGRFETFLFETLASAAELRGKAGAAEVANATVHAIEGRDSDLAGVGARAANASLDDLLAPEVMTPAFRELLLRTGPMLDTAFPYDLDAVRATALPSGSELGEEIHELAAAYGLGQLQVLASPVLGPICVPARSFPPTLVLGATLVDQPESAERTFLLHRAMKVLQSNAAVFARTAPIDLWPLLAAYLRTFNREFSPQGVDATRFAEAQQRLARAVPDGLPADTSILAGDVVGTIGNRASTLNSAINGWGSRAGLLATGNPNVALTAIAWAGGNANGPPSSGKDRLTWIGRNAEARDLMIFSVADAYADARSRTSG
jgi:tetratricopeptide (TPR) repeat protein